MSAEDAGTIEAELRLKVTQMEKDIVDAQKKMDTLASNIGRQGTNAGKGFADGMKRGFDTVDMYTARIGKSIATKLAPAMIAVQAGIKIIQGIGNAIKDAFMSNEKFSKSFTDFKTTLGASFTAAAKPVSDWFANLLDKATKSMKQTKELKEALDKIKKENFPDPTTDTVQALKDATDAKNKSWDDYIKKQDAVIAKNDRLKQQAETWQDSFADSAKAYDIIMKGTSQDVLDLFNTLSDTSIVGGDLTSIIQTKSELKGLIDAEIDAKAKFENAMKTLNEVQETTGNATADVAQKLIDANNEYALSIKTLKLKKDNFAITDKEYTEAQISALNNLINKQAELLATGQATRIEQSIWNAELKENIALRNQLQDSLNKGNNDDADSQKQISDARDAAIAKQQDAEKKIRDANAAGLIDEDEMNKQINATLETKYNDLEGIVLQYKLSTGETVRLRNETAALVKTNQDNVKAADNLKKIEEIQATNATTLTNQTIAQLNAKAASAKTDKERNKYIDEAIQLENSLIDAQRQVERTALETSDEFKAQSEEVRIQILNDFDKITQGMKKPKEADDNNNIFQSKEYNQAVQLAGASVDLISSISDAALEIARKNADEQMAIIEDSLNNTLATIEKARNDELIASGVAVQNSADSLEAQLEATKRTGDEILIYQAQRRLEEQQINDKYDEQAAKAKEDAEKEKSKIEYKVAVQEYEQQIIQAVNAGVMAAMQALSAAPPPYNFILMGLSAAATAVQMGLLLANPPKPPKFETGGIVPGNSYSGDKIPALVNSGELILNQSQQDNIAGQLNRGAVSATIVVMLDTNEIARSTVDLVNDGFYTIKARAVR